MNTHLKEYEFGGGYLKRFVLYLISCIVICNFVTIPLFADENVISDMGFEGIEIVKAETYQPIDRDVSESLKNVSLGGDPIGPMYRSKSVSEPYWKTENGIKNFYDADGNLMYHHGSKMIIDVSEHNGEIDWQKVKNAGIDGAILRVGWGYLGEDAQFKRNIQECNRLGIPYGVYLYSYAYDANFAFAEAEGTVEMLSKVSVNLSYPIYYDIEAFKEWNDNGVTRKHPNDPAEYEKIIATYINRMSELGYGGKVHVYSYRSYLQNQLNSQKILSYVSWIAAYTRTLGYDNKYYSGIEGWQYTSSGKVNGISGRTDISCFGDQMFNNEIANEIPEVINTQLRKQGLSFSGGNITGFKIGSTLTDYATGFSTAGVVTFYNKRGSALSGGKVATGQTVSFVIEENGRPSTYNMNIILRGDVNGDGRISAIDYSIIKNHILKISKLDGSEFYAGDVNRSGNISAIDYSLVKNDILNIGKIKQ